MFFFQAEDGMRFVAVTGVQTCALPIYVPETLIPVLDELEAAYTAAVADPAFRSEERRVGKSVDLGGRRIIKKKKKEGMRVDDEIANKLSRSTQHEVDHISTI